MRTVEDQKNLIKYARKNKGISLATIKAARHILYASDLAKYKEIINAATDEGAFDIYCNMDTAARDDFMELICE